MPAFPLLALNHLVDYNTNYNHCPQHSKIQRTRYSKQINKITKHKDKRRADENADNGTLTSAKRAAAEDGGGDAIEFIEVAMRGRGNRIRVEGKKDL